MKIVNGFINVWIRFQFGETKQKIHIFLSWLKKIDKNQLSNIKFYVPVLTWPYYFFHSFYYRAGVFALWMISFTQNANVCCSNHYGEKQLHPQYTHCISAVFFGGWNVRPFLSFFLRLTYEKNSAIILIGKFCTGNFCFYRFKIAHVAN